MDRISYISYFAKMSEYKPESKKLPLPNKIIDEISDVSLKIRNTARAAMWNQIEFEIGKSEIENLLEQIKKLKGEN